MARVFQNKTRNVEMQNQNIKVLIIVEHDPVDFISHTPNANMADRSVVARNESHGSEVSKALMFCFDRKVLPRRRSGVLCFALHNRFCVRKCYVNGAKSSTVGKVLFFVSQLASEGKTDERKEFMIAEGTVEVCFVTFQQISI